MQDVPQTEAVDPATKDLDRLATPELTRVLLQAQRRANVAVEAAAPALAEAVDEIVARLRAGGTLHYVGAGTSGRLAFVDASEQPPTFGTDPRTVRAHMAGGRDALVRAIEGAEDDADAARRDLTGEVERGDVVVGISASGGARYVIAALDHARSCGAFAIAIANVANSPLVGAADLAIVLDTGPEPIAGSTRLIAGTAQKLALNALSTATMVRLGKVYGNLMVDLVATNEKLRGRALRLVRALAGVDAEPARAALDAASGSVKVAVVMLRRGIEAEGARALLAQRDGILRAVLEDS